MEELSDGLALLDMITAPVLCVKNAKIIQLNEAASRLFLRKGMALDSILESGAEEYAAFGDSLLCVTLSVHGQLWGATVTRHQGYDLFTLDQQFDSSELRILALAARELRDPLTSALLAAQQLSDASGDKDNPDIHRMNRSLNRLLRIIGNMSDAADGAMPVRYEKRNIDALLREIAEKAAANAASTGAVITYEGLSDDQSVMVDAQLLERAALNMIANAMKFAGEGPISLTLRRQNNLLFFSVSDKGSGIADSVRSTLFRRHLREPAIEDGRFGIGLGMQIIRQAASAHGGAVLVDHPEGCGTRVTITINTCREIPEALCSPRLTIDYAGETDHVLLELSDILPYQLY